MVADIDSMLETGELWTYGHGQAAVASAGTAKIGITTGPHDVRVLARSYVSTGSPMTIRLYKVPFTGGSAVNSAYNRNLSAAGAVQPVAMLGGVTFTPNTPLITITVQASTGTGSAQLTVSDDQPINLDKNTQYVLELVNSAAGNADLGFSATLRRKQASESLR